MSYTLKIRVTNNGNRTECILVPRARRFLVTCTGWFQIKLSGSGDENGLSGVQFSSIWTVIIRVINKIGWTHGGRSNLLYHEYDYRPVYDERTNKIPKTIILKLKNYIESQCDVCPKAFLVRMNYGDLSDITLSVSVWRLYLLNGMKPDSHS